MKYLLLVYADKPDANDAVFQSDAELLREDGYLLSAFYLQTAASSGAVRLRSGELSLPDVSSTKTQGQLAALYIINARDLNEAVRVAARLSAGSAKCLVEVRSLSDFDWLSR